MSQEKVIELSVEETNELRIRLGLAPLRGTKSNSTNTATANEVVLEMSMDESNQLRNQLGLPPLRTSNNNNKVIHAPAIHQGQAQQIAERIDKAKLQRQVQKGISKFAQNQFKDNHTTAKSWAAQMRSMQSANAESTVTTKQQQHYKEQHYKEQDLEGLQVAHAVEDLAEGSTTVLTLSDVNLLQQDEHAKVVGLNENNEQQQQLENVQLTERRKIEKSLQQKRHAGGYTGLDDDEFEELGGQHAAAKKGFQIGAYVHAEEEEDELDVFAKQGKAISLETKADVTAADFMTAAEEAEMNKNKLFKRKDKKKKKSKRKNYDSEEGNDVTRNDLISELEATAEVIVTNKKRRRLDDDGEEEDKMQVEETIDARPNRPSKHSQYEAAVERGNQRTNQAFAVPKKSVAQDEDAEPDDAFLDAALDKARRLHRLKAISGLQRSGAASVVEAVQNAAPVVPTSSGGVEFSVDETREFTRALQTRTEQTKREKKKDGNISTTSNISIKQEDKESDNVIEELKEMAKSVKEDASDVMVEGVTGTTASIGRGVGSFLQLLQQTGESALKKGGHEEMRGRAKDEKTYEDYERLDLSKVVRLDMKTATEKDKELAQREVKLEYRDSHGRLLTRKEAFRELCYQFHGHGSGKRKEEKKLQQIAREQAEARAARQEHTLGALKATQKATGKAFVVHKT